MSEPSSALSFTVRRKPLAQRLAEHFMVLALAGMVAAVFVNVVLRYLFNTSIVSYEEISRLLFVWLVAVGTIVAAWEGSHLGFDMVTSRVSPAVRKGLFWASQALILLCMGLLLWGSWGQVVAGLDSVNMDHEMNVMAKNTLMYNALTDITKREFGDLQRVISEGGK